MNCRGLRLEWVAGLGMALALPVLPAAAAPAIATQTSLNVETSDQSGHTQATADDLRDRRRRPARKRRGRLEDGSTPAGRGSCLNANGQATAAVSLPAGDHALRAVYTGDAVAPELSLYHQQRQRPSQLDTELSPSRLRPLLLPRCRSPLRPAVPAPSPSPSCPKTTLPSRRPCSSRFPARDFPAWPLAPLRRSRSKFCPQRPQAAPPVRRRRLARLSVPC